MVGCVFCHLCFQVQHGLGGAFVNGITFSQALAEQHAALVANLDQQNAASIKGKSTASGAAANGKFSFKKSSSTLASTPAEASAVASVLLSGTNVAINQASNEKVEEQQQQGDGHGHRQSNSDDVFLEASSLDWRSDAVALPGTEDLELGHAVLHETQHAQHGSDLPSVLPTSPLSVGNTTVSSRTAAAFMRDMTPSGSEALNLARIASMKSQSQRKAQEDTPYFVEGGVGGGQGFRDSTGSVHRHCYSAGHAGEASPGALASTATSGGGATLSGLEEDNNIFSGKSPSGRDLYRSESAPASTLRGFQWKKSVIDSLRPERSFVDLTSPEATAVASNLSLKLSRKIDNALLQELLRLARYRILQPAQAGHFRPPTTVLAARHERRGSNPTEKGGPSGGALHSSGSLEDPLPLNAAAAADVVGQQAQPAKQTIQCVSAVAVAADPDRKPSLGDPFGEEVIILMGLIDWLQPYNMRKKLEHGYKSVVQDSKGISVIEPRAYAKRFLSFMGTVFLRGGGSKDQVGLGL